MKDLNTEDFKIKDAIQLSEIPTTYDLNESKKSIEKELEKVREKLGDFQNTIYAHDKYAVLICLQGMDTSGNIV